MEEYEMSAEVLEKLGEEKLAIDEEAFEVNESICKDCGEKMIKIVENKSILDGSLTFHIIKLKCPRCGKEYLDLDQAEKYDFAILLEKASKASFEKLMRKVQEI